MSDLDLDLINPDLLPPQVREIVRVIGLAETITLLDERHGLPTTMPTHADSRTCLRGVISDESIARLADSKLAGKHYRDLPTSSKPFKQLRNATIAASDEPLSALARTHKLSRRQIINIRNEVGSPPPQVDLFNDSGIG